MTTTMSGTTSPAASATASETSVCLVWCTASVSTMAAVSKAGSGRRLRRSSARVNPAESASGTVRAADALGAPWATTRARAQDTAASGCGVRGVEASAVAPVVGGMGTTAGRHRFQPLPGGLPSHTDSLTARAGGT
ncbi:hypothetical protein [Streptomyces sp. MOE7]|uniref:hypothetical protein n=1 Tax=Streptomyces sp. MOE7 TaxID=1961713 RepID=UPI001F17AAEF|nr:hypothetical protein [Streptomyces sp. MOE7]